MAMRVDEIMEWLKTLREDDLVGVDDGGLMLEVVDNSAEYLEIGGLPLEGDDHES
jgi:hypothetical protein